MTKRTWIYSVAALALILILGGTSYVVHASSSNAVRNSAVYSTGTCPPDESKVAIPDDGLDQLPQNYLAVSYSALLLAGDAKPVHLNLKADPNAEFQPKGGSPQTLVTWSPEYNASGLSSSDEPDGNLHPSDPANMLISGNHSLDTTIDGGSTWHSLYPPWNIVTSDVVAAFAPTSSNQDTAIATGLINCTPTCQLAAGRSTDWGVTWQPFSPTNLNSPGYFNDRPDLWSDNDPTSPFYGRMYLTESLEDPLRTQSYNTVVTKYSTATDNGQSWSSFFVHDNTSTYSTDGNKTFGSMGFGPNGTVYVGWMASRCCSSQFPPSVDVPNKHRWARSTDGGVTFSAASTAATDPLARSIVFNNYSPAGFRWTAQTDIGVDPVAENGNTNMYMIWLRFRRDIPENETGDGAAVFITSSTNGGSTWSTPMPVYDDPDCHATQYMPWVEVSKDHTVHVTYTSDVGGSRTTLAHFYTQSTDRGQTWSTPYQLSGATYPPDVSFMGDYQQADIQSYPNYGVEKFLATWTDNRNGREHYARVGTFPLPNSTPTPTATPGVCPPGPDYTFTSSTSSIVPGTDLVPGSQCDNCVAPITLPFPFTLYDSSGVSDGPQEPHSQPQSSPTAWVSSNGNLQFETQITSPHNYSVDCQFPILNFGQTIFAYWGDLSTYNPQLGYGVFTSTSGTAPNRIFNIEWRACQKDDNTGGCTASANFEIRLYEGQSKFDLFYNALTINKDDPNNPNGTNGVNTNPNIGYKEEVVVGVQQNSSHYTPFACDTPGAPLYSGTLLTFTRLPYCPPPTNTPRPTSTPTFTPTPTATCPPPPTPTNGCIIQFTDVPPLSTFYPYVHCLACQGFVSGYACGGPGEPCDCYNSPYYRPGNDVWRGQLSKIVVLARLLAINSNVQRYQDVPPGSTYYDYVNTLTNITPQVVSGYDCGGQDEPCVLPSNLPYFRLNNPATRGQTAKIVLLACDDCPQASRHFQDVAPGSTFYTWVEQLAQEGAVSGYACGGQDEPCVPPGNLPYFRPNNVTSRGQAAQIIKIAVYPNCPYMRSLPGSLPQASVTAQQTATVPPYTPSVTPAGTSTVVSVTGTPTTPTVPTGSPTPQETMIVPSPWPTVPLPIPTGYIPPPIPTVP